MKTRAKVPLSTFTLTIAGALLAVVGLWLAFAGAPAGPTPPVFRALGGSLFSAGLLTCYVAVTSFRTRGRGAAAVVAIAGAASIGTVGFAGFLIDARHTWPVLALVALWLVALAFYRLEGAGLARGEMVGGSARAAAPARGGHGHV